ncbi:MAG: phosphatidate cytidylyltransferase [Treponema sp.]|jgi:phosphatidate cytidylyltransferase|nr:phosphatidate cytidylyltransferase [Treponema sp.]
MTPKILIARLFIFFAGLPAVVALIIFLPHYNHLALNALVILVSMLGAAEFARMLRFKGFELKTAEAVLLGCLSPVSMTLIVSFDTNYQITQSLFVIGASWLLVSEVFIHHQNFSSALHRVTAGFAVMMYPGLFLSWTIHMASLKHATMVILGFSLTVIANDSIAWACGNLFGRNNRGIFKASPGKSLAGFIGGLASSVAVCVLLVIFFPASYESDQISPIPSGVILGLLSGIAVTFGDLSESVLKRCCGLKDSGYLIPGRGGVLDSVDSFAFSAPVFYILFRYFFDGAHN